MPKSLGKKRVINDTLADQSTAIANTLQHHAESGIVGQIPGGIVRTPVNLTSAHNGLRTQGGTLRGSLPLVWEAADSDDEYWDELPTDQGTVWVADLSTLSITSGDIGTWARGGLGIDVNQVFPAHLYTNNGPMWIAKWPLGDPRLYTSYAELTMTAADTYTIVTSGRPSLTDNTGLMAFTCAAYHWAWQWDIATVSSDTLTLNEDFNSDYVPGGYPYDKRHGYLFNRPEFLGPNSFWIDTSNLKVYAVFNGNPSTPPQTRIDVCTDELIYINGANGIVLNEPIVEHGRSEGIFVRDSDNIYINDLICGGVGREALRVYAFGASEDNSNVILDGGSISGCRAGGVRFWAGKPSSLTEGNCGARNVRFTRGSLFDIMQQVAALEADTLRYVALANTSGVGCFIEDNIFTDQLAGAIKINGNLHSVKRNYIRNACSGVSDAGAIYVRGGEAEYCGGHEVDYNSICGIYTLHDIGEDEHDAAIGIYLDDGASYSKYRFNTIHNADWGFHVGGGRENTITDNVLFELETVWMRLDGRRCTGQNQHVAWDSGGSIDGAQTLADMSALTAEAWTGHATMGIIADGWNATTYFLPENTISNNAITTKDAQTLDSLFVPWWTYDANNFGDPGAEGLLAIPGSSAVSEEGESSPSVPTEPVLD